jgi:hypothetical protein
MEARAILVTVPMAGWDLIVNKLVSLMTKIGEKCLLIVISLALKTEKGIGRFCLHFTSKIK